MNQVGLIGRLTKDPELRYTPQGTAVTTFTLAVDKDGKDNGAEFIDIVVWQKAAENVAQYCKKGKQVSVEGRLQSRIYEKQDGTKVKQTEVVAHRVKFLSSGNQGGNDGIMAGATIQPADDDTPFTF